MYPGLGPLPPVPTPTPTPTPTKSRNVESKTQTQKQMTCLYIYCMYLSPPCGQFISYIFHWWMKVRSIHIPTFTMKHKKTWKVCAAVYLQVAGLQLHDDDNNNLTYLTHTHSLYHNGNNIKKGNPNSTKRGICETRNKNLLPPGNAGTPAPPK